MFAKRSAPRPGVGRPRCALACNYTILHVHFIKGIVATVFTFLSLTGAFTYITIELFSLQPKIICCWLCDRPIFVKLLAAIEITLLVQKILSSIKLKLVCKVIFTHHESIKYQVDSDIDI